MKAKIHNAGKQHEDMYQEIMEVLKRHCDASNMSSVELLAVVSSIVGRVLALQDQRKSKTYFMDIVRLNMEHGNRVMIEEIVKMKPEGSA